MLGLVAYEQVRKRLFPHKAKLSSVHPPAQLKGTELTVAIDGVWRQKFQFPPFQVLGEKALSPPVSWFFPPKFDLGVLQESFLDHHGGRFWQRFRSCVVHLLEPLDNVRSGGSGLNKPVRGKTSTSQLGMILAGLKTHQLPTQPSFGRHRWSMGHPSSFRAALRSLPKRCLPMPYSKRKLRWHTGWPSISRLYLSREPLR